MPLAVLDVKVVLLLLGAAVVAIGLLVLIILVLLYGLKKIFGDQFKVDYKIEFKSTTLMVLCSLLTVFSLLVVIVDEDGTDKMIATGILVGALAAVGVNVKLIKLPKVQPEVTRGTSDGS